VLLVRARVSAFAVLAVLLVSAPSAADARTGLESSRQVPEYAPGELIVKFKGGTAPDRIGAIASAEGASLKQTPERDGLSFLRLDAAGSVFDAVARFERLPEVEYAAPNLIGRAFFVPNDSVIHQGDEAWNLRDVGAYDAWDVVTGSPDVVLAIIDTGVAFEEHVIPDYERVHLWPGSAMYRQSPDLPGPFRPGWDFVNNDAYPDDDAGHGTEVATIAAGAANNLAGSAGIAFGVTILPVKVLRWDREGEMSDIVQGIRFAADQGADIANLSLGFPPIELYREFGYPSNVLAHMFYPLRDAVSYARRRGTILVAAAGNFGRGDVSPPAAYPGVISVAATGVENRLASYSSFGKGLSFAAPGGDFLDENGDHIQDQIPVLGIKPYRSEGSLAKPDSFNVFYFIGTSAAAPHVSGAVALLMSLGIREQGAIEQTLRSTASMPYGKPNAYSEEYGFGLIQIDKAVRNPVSLGAPRVAAALARNPLDARIASGNPGRGEVAVAFRTTRAGPVSARVYDTRGALVRTLTQGERPAGPHTLRWDGRNARGERAASGVYFIRVESAEGTSVRKLAYLH
jgi:serine protease